MPEATAPAQQQITTLPKDATGEGVETGSQTGPELISGNPGQVTLGNALVVPNTSMFRAFVATDVNSTFIFATLAETNGVPQPTMYCGVRYFNGRYGVLITLLSPIPIPPNVIVIVTLLQDGASTYANPVLYTGN